MKDILSDLTHELYTWLNFQTEFYILLEKDEIINDITNIIYNNYYKLTTDQKHYDFFSLKFNEDIYDIYTKYYNIITIDIGNNVIKNNFMILFDYIYDIIEFIDENDELEDNVDDHEIYLTSFIK